MFISLKYSFVKFIEKIPSIQMLVYNNLIFFKFLLPQDKDYLALKILFNKNEKRTFIDVVEILVYLLQVLGKWVLKKIKY